MIKIIEIERLINIYGEQTTLGQLLEDKKNKTPYKCPKCNGKGEVQVKYNSYPDNLPDSGWVERWAYKYIKCDLCGGEGYTIREFKPKLVQQGWEQI
ncbi:hypothetical protein [Cetobacterium sp.]|uniref:hypothetical protein n=1 Tax=Cetobacterium sp. TaxID=2071632 RepID=UPI003EE5163E